MSRFRSVRRGKLAILRRLHFFQTWHSVELRINCQISPWTAPHSAVSQQELVMLEEDEEGSKRKNEQKNLLLLHSNVGHTMKKKQNV